MQRFALGAAVLLSLVFAGSAAQADRGMHSHFTGGFQGGFHDGFRGGFHDGFHPGFFHDRFFFRDRFFFHDRFFHDRFFFRHTFFHPFFFFGAPVFEPVPIALFPPLPYPAYAYGPAGGGYSQGTCYQVQTTIIINGQQTPAWATACQQPDGSWRIVP